MHKFGLTKDTVCQYHLFEIQYINQLRIISFHVLVLPKLQNKRECFSTFNFINFPIIGPQNPISPGGIRPDFRISKITQEPHIAIKG